jgi:hypothetical protein
VGVWFALAVFGVVNVAYLWFQRSRLRDLAVQSGIPADRAGSAVAGLLAQLTVITVVFGAGYVVFASLLKRRRRWARVALTVLGLLHLLWSLLIGVSPAGVVVVLLIAVGVALTWRPSTRQWLNEGE